MQEEEIQVEVEEELVYLSGTDDGGSTGTTIFADGRRSRGETFFFLFFCPKQNVSSSEHRIIYL